MKDEELLDRICKFSEVYKIYIACQIVRSTDKIKVYVYNKNQRLDKLIRNYRKFNIVIIKI